MEWHSLNCVLKFRCLHLKNCCWNQGFCLAVTKLERHGVSNHWQVDYCLPFFRLGSKKICDRWVTKAVTRSFDVFFDPRLNKRLSKQLWGWWFETPSHPLWRHSNVYFRKPLLNHLQCDQHPDPMWDKLKYTWRAGAIVGVIRYLCMTEVV